MFDVVVVGAGLAGLSCAREVQSQGFSVLVLEKSRGLGGRGATRRVEGACFNYGARYFEATGIASAALLAELQHPASHDAPEWVEWPQTRVMIRDSGDDEVQPVTGCYVPAMGMTAIAKYLARDIEVHRQHRVSALQLNSNQTWDVFIDSEPNPIVSTRAVVLAIPAPQAEMLLAPLGAQGLPDDFFNAVQSVQFDACFTVITGYSPDPKDESSKKIVLKGDDFDFPDHSDLQWAGVVRSPSIGLTQQQPISNAEEESQSRDSLIIVAQSSPSFAQQHLEDGDRQTIGQHLVSTLSHQLSEPLIQHYDWMQVHLWRYALCRQPIRSPFLLTQIPGIIGCSGDWCGGHQIDHALWSGSALGRALSTTLNENERH
jgi:predicted NAD/FAD-dependent oxidoreductase